MRTQVGATTKVEENAALTLPFPCESARLYVGCSPKGTRANTWDKLRVAGEHVRSGSEKAP